MECSKRKWSIESFPIAVGVVVAVVVAVVASVVDAAVVAPMIGNVCY